MFRYIHEVAIWAVATGKAALNFPGDTSEDAKQLFLSIRSRTLFACLINASDSY